MSFKDELEGMLVTEIDNREFIRLNQVTCGEVVHLQIITATKPIRLKTRLIGVDPNMSIILAFGTDQYWEKSLPHIKESKDVIVRFMNNDEQQASVIAFRSSIQKIMTIAGRWLVLDYPKAIESAELRQHLRVSVKIGASLLDSDGNSVLISGMLSDISIQGCAFITKQKVELDLHNLYRLSINIEGENTNIDLSVALKNIQNSILNGSTQYGLAFMTPESETKLSIQQLLLHHLQK